MWETELRFERRNLFFFPLYQEPEISITPTLASAHNLTVSLTLYIKWRTLGDSSS